MKMLNQSDLQLIAALEADGRASYAHLARGLGISVSTAAKRVKSLLDERVLTINAIPNPYRLGYNAHAVIAMNVSMDKIDSVCARLKNNFNVNLIVTTFGRFNLLIVVFFPSWEKLHDFISSELSAAGDIYEVETFFIKETKKRFDDIFGEGSSHQTPTKVDVIDQKIIELLAVDGRYSGLHLSKKLGISVSSVSKRLAHLLNQNVFTIRAISNPTMVGFHANAFILIRADHSKIDEICEKLKTYPGTNAIMTLINGYDIYVSMVSTDHETLYRLLKKNIASLSGVINTETWIRGEIIKRYYGTFR